MSWLPACLCAVPVALVVDWCWGEPPAWAHPVVAMGRYLGAIGPRLTALSPGAAFVGGAMAWVWGACIVAVLALGAEMLWRWLVAQWTASPLALVLLQGLGLGLLLKPLLAWRMLRDEVAGVEQALARSLPDGRARLQRLVSRDVSELDEVAVRESAIESLAENLNDSLVAPLFWFAVAGLGGAAVYRFANTADAMWGYRGRYEWAGKWAARVDDALSWVPARLTACLLCLAALQWPAWRDARAQARLTPSPNGGWPMGTMALLLGVALRKPGVYALNAQAGGPTALHTAWALRWCGRAVWWAGALCMASLCGRALLVAEGWL
ncbi:MAG: adenosylcobinamide-phosphate synthase CbiB [Aquabacterium sp.]